MAAQCGKGWTERCAHAKSRKCTCRCGGENHGKARPVEESGEPRPEITEVLGLVGPDITPRVIERFDYVGYFEKRATTHLTICGKVVIATERDDNPGASITNAAENLWAKVREQFGDDIIAIEHYPKRGGISEDWDLVTIVNGEAEWSSLSREAVADLIAGRLLPLALELADERTVHDDDELDAELVEQDSEAGYGAGRVFYPGDERALNAAIDDYVTRTPPHPWDDE